MTLCTAWFCSCFLQGNNPQQALAAKTISVDRDGRNEEACWDGGEDNSCQTLDFAVGGLESDTAILVSYSHDFSNDSFSRVGNLANVSLMGAVANATAKQQEGLVEISCLQLGNGLAFNGTRGLTISHLYWKNCSVLSPSNAVTSTNSSQRQTHHVYAGLFFYAVSNLTIDHCGFTSSRGLGAALYDVTGAVRISHTTFQENAVLLQELLCVVGEHELAPSEPSFLQQRQGQPCSSQGGGLFVELTQCGGFDMVCEWNTTSVKYATYIIDSCKFLNNTNNYETSTIGVISHSTSLYNPFNKGGGLSIQSRGGNYGNTFHVSNSVFVGNRATWGGGMTLDILDNTTNTSFCLSNNTFTSNSAVISNNIPASSGGGLRIALLSSAIADSASSLTSVHLVGTNFTNNSGLWGGGAVIVKAAPVLRKKESSLVLLLMADVVFESCVWESNIGLWGAAMGLVDLERASSIQTKVFPSFRNCTFRLNHVLQRETPRMGQGAIYSSGMSTEFRGKTLLSRNYGTAVAVMSASMKFVDEVVFEENEGLYGGAIYMNGLCFLSLHEGLRLHFISNHAFRFGGALYYVYPPSIGYNITEACFIQYSKGFSTPVNNWEIQVVFEQNTADIGGNAMYIGNPPGCYYPNGDFLFDQNKTRPLNFTNNRPPVISTPANTIDFNIPNNTIKLSPGGIVDIPVLTKDYFRSPENFTAFYLRCTNYTGKMFEDTCGDGLPYKIHGSQLAAVGYNRSIKSLTVKGPLSEKSNDTSKGNDLALMVNTFEVQPILHELRVELVDCDPGLYFHNATNSCKCLDFPPDTFKCIRSSDNGYGTTCVREGYWFGRLEGTGGAMHSVMSQCYLQHCAMGCSEPCSVDLAGWCKIPKEESKECLQRHSGPLCTLCDDNHSCTYGCFQCVPSNTCETKKTVLLLAFIVFLWIAIVLALLMSLRMDVRIGLGYLYCFVYYFSVLWYITGDNLQNDGVNVFVAVCESIVTLNPFFLGAVDLCFIRDISPIQMSAFMYVNSLTIFVLLLTLLAMDRYCPQRLSILNGVSSPVHVICILLLFTYSSLFESTTKILNPMEFSSAYPTLEKIFVKVEPSTEYFHPTRHLPYALLAIAMELFLLIPFSLLLVLAPFLVRWVNFTRIKPLLDQYQSCFKDSCRWFAGYYFICRHVLFFTTIGSMHPSVSVLLQQVATTLILVVHVWKQPYRERWMNLLDAVFLFDLSVLTFLKQLEQSDVLLAARVVLISIPFLYFCLTSFIIVCMNVRNMCRCIRRRRKGVDHPPETSNTSNTADREDALSVLNDSACEYHPLISSSASQARYSGHGGGRGSGSRGSFKGLYRTLSGGMCSHVKFWRSGNNSSLHSSLKTDSGGVSYIDERDRHD